MASHEWHLCRRQLCQFMQPWPEEGCVTSLPAYLERVPTFCVRFLCFLVIRVYFVCKFDPMQSFCSLTTQSYFDYGHLSFDVAINKWNGNMFCH